MVGVRFSTAIRLLRIISKSQPNLRLFVRAQRKAGGLKVKQAGWVCRRCCHDVQVFSGDLEGVSLLDEIAQQVRLMQHGRS